MLQTKCLLESDSIWFEGTFSKDNPSKTKFYLCHKLSFTVSTQLHPSFFMPSATQRTSLRKGLSESLSHSETGTNIFAFRQIVQPSYFEANRDLEICQTSMMKPSTFTVSEVTWSDGCHHSLFYCGSQTGLTAAAASMWLAYSTGVTDRCCHQKNAGTASQPIENLITLYFNPTSHL